MLRGGTRCQSCDVLDSRSHSSRYGANPSGEIPGKLGNRAHGVASPQQPVLMDDLVPPASGRFRRDEGGEDLLSHASGQAFPCGAADPLALLRARRPTAVLQLYAPVQVMPEHAHLHVEPRPGDRHSPDFLEQVRSRVHVVTPPDQTALGQLLVPDLRMSILCDTRIVLLPAFALGVRLMLA